MKTLTTLLIVSLILFSGCAGTRIAEQPKQEVKQKKLKKRKLNKPPGYKTFRFQQAYFTRCPVFTSVKHFRYVSKHLNPECCNYAPRWRE